MADVYIKVFYDWAEVTETLSDAEKGRLISALVRYARSGEIVILSGAERHMFPMFKAQIDRDKAKSADISIKRQDAGRLGGVAKSGKIKQTIANASKCYQEKEEEKEKEKDYKPTYILPGEDLSDMFDRFWKTYPRKVGKGAAEKSFTKINPDEDLLEIMLLAIDRDKDSEQWQRDGGQYIPHPSTWLNQKRWLDEPTEASGPEIKLYRAGDPL